jgi:ParB family transcriptional regulator, chromosome partitioning protein
MPKKKPVRRRKKVTARSVGLSAPETDDVHDAAARALASQVVEDGGAALAVYREPFGGTPAVLAALPIDRVEPTPYQRDPSEPHVKRLMTVIEKLGRFLDPIIAVRHDDRSGWSGAGDEAPAERRPPGGVQGPPPIYWTPNGNHRLQAMRKLGAKSIVALVVPDAEVAFKILALNTEKAHSLKEKSLETIRMLRALAEERTTATEREFAFEFDQAPFLTLGAAYEQRPRLSGGAYNPVLRRIDHFLDDRLPQAVKERARRAGLLLKIDDGVTEIVTKLKKRGFTSPYLRPFIVARINPIRFSTSTEFDFDDVLGRMQKNADKFNVERVRQEDVVRAGGGPAEEES